MWAVGARADAEIHAEGRLAAAGQRRGRTTPVNDTWIAVCCLAESLPLATFNTKDYTDSVDNHGLRLVGLDRGSGVACRPHRALTTHPNTDIPRTLWGRAASPAETKAQIPHRYDRGPSPG